MIGTPLVTIDWYSSGDIPGLLRNGQGADCGLDRVGKPDDLKEGRGIRRHTSPANHRIPHSLDESERKKIRRMLCLGYKGTACLVNQSVSSSSLREPSARWRKVKYFSSGVETIFKPLTRKKPSETTNAVRLFPSTKA